MADVTLQSRPATSAEPLAVAHGDLQPAHAGPWSAHLEFADQVPPPTGAVTLTWLGRQWLGRVLRSGASSAGRTYALIVGGNGHLSEPTPPILNARAYRNTAARLVVQQLLTEAGETLSAASDSAVLSQSLTFWPRRRDTAQRLLDDIARKLKCVWRVLADGSVWFGRDAYAETTSTDLQALDIQDPSKAVADFVPHSFGPVPGEAYQGRRVGAAQHTISPDGPFLRLWYLDSATTDLDEIGRAHV